MQDPELRRPMQALFGSAKNAPGDYQPMTTRALDYEYDPVYTVSGKKENEYESARADMARKMRLEIRPIFRTMFSTLPRLPRRHVVLAPRPEPLSRDMSGPIQHIRKEKHLDVNGMDRHKFFNRPHHPLLQNFIAAVRYAPTYVPRPPSPVHDKQGKIKSTVEEFKKTVTRGTQTMYRESEAQTDPYSPPYKVRSAMRPEVLDIAHLSWGHGIPAGIREVEAIDRIRDKRAVIEALPELQDERQKRKRQKMLADLEISEWLAREMEIERLRILQHQLWGKAYEKKKEDKLGLLSQKLDRIWASLDRRKERAMTRIRHKHDRDARRLYRQYKSDNEKYGSPDRAYSKASTAQTSATRFGNAQIEKGQVIRIGNYYLDKYTGLKELENTSRMLNYNVHFDTGEISTLYISPESHTYIPRRYRDQHQLQYLHEAAAWVRDGDMEDKSSLDSMVIELGEPASPPTPSIPGPHPLDEEEYQAVICLQKIMYGRAVQSLMYHKIDEEDQINNLTNEEKISMQKEEDSLLQQQKDKTEWMIQESTLNDLLESVEGVTLGCLLDFLSEELVRLQDEQKIHSFALLAESDRVLNEAEESGKRHGEEQSLREEEELFKKAVGIEQPSVDPDLKDQGTQWKSETKAENLVQQLVLKINETAHLVEQRATEIPKEEMVSELVHGFILPESRKKLMRQRVRHLQQKHLTEAQEAVNLMFKKQQKIQHKKQLLRSRAHPPETEVSLTKKFRVTAVEEIKEKKEDD